MQTIISVDNQRLIAFVVQIWFRKKGVYLVTNRTVFEGDSTGVNLRQSVETVSYHTSHPQATDSILIISRSCSSQTNSFQFWLAGIPSLGAVNSLISLNFRLPFSIIALKEDFFPSGGRLENLEFTFRCMMHKLPNLSTPPSSQILISDSEGCLGYQCSTEFLNSKEKSL